LLSSFQAEARNVRKRNKKTSEAGHPKPSLPMAPEVRTKEADKEDPKV
jgi:hypothetical protein